MKRRLIIIVCIALLTLGLLGCQKEEKLSEDSWTNKPKSKDDDTSNKLDPITTIIQATSTDPRTGRMVTKLGGFSADLDKDGVDEIIELHTAAGRDEKGNMAWDDGQNWLLVVVDENEYYPIFDQYVQLGSVYYTIWYDLEDNPGVTVIVSTGVNLSLKNFTYDAAQKGYKVQRTFDNGGINTLFSSLSGY